MNGEDNSRNQKQQPALVQLLNCGKDMNVCTSPTSPIPPSMHFNVTKLTKPPPSHHDLTIDPLVGLQQLGRFVITSTISETLFGKVYSGFDKMTRKPVIVKVSSLGLANSQIGRGNVAVFENVHREAVIHGAIQQLMAQQVEMKVAVEREEEEEEENEMERKQEEQPRTRTVIKSNNCPYIGNFLMAFEDQKYHYIISELLLGGDMFQNLVSASNSRFDETLVKKHALEILSALVWLKKHDIVHSDLSLENVCLDSNGAARLIDFGMASFHPHSVYRPGELNQFPCAVTLDEECMKFGPTPRNKFVCKVPKLFHKGPGKTSYMSHELFCGKPWDAYQNDLWSFGVILYVMAVGVPPFKEPNFNDVWFSVIFSGEWLTERIKSQPPAASYRNLNPLLLNLLDSIFKPEYLRPTLQMVINHKFFEI
jgi:serine/threonine protein kinase